MTSAIPWFDSGGGSPSFSLDLQDSIVAAFASGSGTPTYSRASVATQRDFENLYRTALSGEARFQGARRVYNKIAYDSLSALTSGTGTAVVTANYAAAPDGTVTAFRLQATRGSGFGLAASGPGGTSGYSNPHTSAHSIYMKSNTASSQSVGLGSSQGANAIVTVTTAWKRFAYNEALNNNVDGTYIGAIGASDATLDILYVWPQEEDITGVTITAPSEYVSSGVLSAPYHGAGVDGVKYFSTLNGNTVASNVVTEATGAPIVTGASGVAANAPVDARGPFGYLAEGAATQLVTPTASIRDMTDASWVAGATMTVAKNAIGADGTANGASTLTGGAVEATNTILQTLVAAASSRTNSALVRLVSGTGPVYLMQGATASADLFSSLNTSTYSLLELNASVLNVAFGFKLGVNTVIEVDMNQFEALAFATSRILTAGATREVDALSFPVTGNISGTNGTAYAEFTTVTVPSAAGVSLVSSNNGGTEGVPLGAILGTQEKLFMYDGTSTGVLSSVITRPVVSVMKVATSWGGSSWSGSVGGVVVSASTFDGNLNLTSSISIGSDENATGMTFGTIRKVRIWTVAKTAAQLAQMTT